MLAGMALPLASTLSGIHVCDHRVRNLGTGFSVMLVMSQWEASNLISLSNSLRIPCEPPLLGKAENIPQDKSVVSLLFF